MTELSQRKQFRFALAGAYAVNAYGLGRFTNDLDLLAPQSAQAELVALFESKGFETLNRSEGFSNHLHAHAELGRVDIIYVNDATAAKLFPSCRRAVMAGVDVAVPRAEHLIAMKLQAIRSNPARLHKDMVDVRHLLHTPGLDRELARTYFEQYGFMNEWEELLRQG